MLAPMNDDKMSTAWKNILLRNKLNSWVKLFEPLEQTEKKAPAAGCGSSRAGRGHRLDY